MSNSNLHSRDNARDPGLRLAILRHVAGRPGKTKENISYDAAIGYGPDAFGVWQCLEGLIAAGLICATQSSIGGEMMTSLTLTPAGRAALADADRATGPATQEEDRP